MRVCVAISVRNGERFIAEAIESVLAQSHTDLELRIYDNLSTDASAEIALRYLIDPRVSYVANEFDLGEWLAKSKVYQPPIGAGAGPFSVTAAYRSAARRIARERIPLAGARLANTLNAELK